MPPPAVPNEPTCGSGSREELEERMPATLRANAPPLVGMLPPCTLRRMPMGVVVSRSRSGAPLITIGVIARSVELCSLGPLGGSATARWGGILVA